MQTAVYSVVRMKETVQEEKGIFLPAHRRIGSSLTRRTDIVWIDTGMKKNEILGIINTHPEFSQFPVCAGTVDAVLGVLTARAFLASLCEPVWPGIKALVKKPLYLSETATILRTLELLEESGCRTGFVIDEYGGIEGLVTRNGLVSELLEEARTNAGEEDPAVFRRNDGSLLVDGQIRMEDIGEYVSLPAPEGSAHDYYTLAGYILAVNGNIPKTGDIIRSGRYQCEIVDMDGHRIDKVLISKIEADEPSGSGTADAQ